MKDFNEFKNSIIKKKNDVEIKKKTQFQRAVVFLPLISFVLILPVVIIPLLQPKNNIVTGFPEGLPKEISQTLMVSQEIVTVKISNVTKGDVVSVNEKDAAELKRLISKITSRESMSTESDEKFTEHYKVLIPMDDGSSHTWFINEKGYLADSLEKMQKLFFDEQLSEELKELILSIFTK